MTMQPTIEDEFIPDRIRPHLANRDAWAIVRELEKGLEELTQNQAIAIFVAIPDLNNPEARGKAIDLLVPRLPSEWVLNYVRDFRTLDPDPDLLPPGLCCHLLRRPGPDCRQGVCGAKRRILPGDFC